MAYYGQQFYPQQYGYQNPYSNQQQFVQQPTFQQPQYPTIYGKVIDGIDVAKSLDVPLGSSFVLPKADGTACYIKGWNNDGTTFIKEYELVGQTDNAQIDFSKKLDSIYGSIDALNKKIDKLKFPVRQDNQPTKKTGGD